jgi:hypothetical protein
MSTWAWALKTTVSTTTRNWPTTQTRRPTSNSTSRSASKNWKAFTPGPTSTSAITRSCPARRSSISIPKPARATFRTVSKRPLDWIGCSLTVLSHAYRVEEFEGGESRVVLSLPAPLAPVKVAVLPLLNKDGLPEKSRRRSWTS